MTVPLTVIAQAAKSHDRLLAVHFPSKLEHVKDVSGHLRKRVVSST